MLKLSNGCLLDPDAIICVIQSSNATKVYLHGDEWLTFVPADGDIIRRYFEEHPRDLRQVREELWTEKLKEMLDMIPGLLSQAISMFSPFLPGFAPLTPQDADVGFPSSLTDPRESNEEVNEE